MGSALARALAQQGHSVGAWNRTPEKAYALAGAGVTPERDLGELVRSTPLHRTGRKATSTSEDPEPIEPN